MLLIGLWCVRVAEVSYRSALVDFEPWQAEPQLSRPAELHIDSLQAIRFSTSRHADIAGWYVPSKNRAAVIIAHGTNADRLSMTTEIQALAAAGFGVLAFDWPGDGLSRGHIEWGNEERAALQAAIDWLASRPDVDPARIGGLGFSFGGLIMAQVAAQDARLHAVVLEATPTSMADYEHTLHGRWGKLSEWPAWVALRHSGFQANYPDPVQLMGRLAPRPVLVVGGEQDTVVPRPMVERLYGAAAMPKELWLVPGAAHGGYAHAAGTAYSLRLQRFFRDALQVSNLG